MRRFHVGVVASFAVVLIGAAGFVGGCSHDDKSKHADSNAMAMHDDCNMCPGIQKATADGKCPECGMQVK